MTRLKSYCLMFLICLLISCSSREKQETFYNNGQIKSREYVKETRDGSYVSDGKVEGWYENGQKSYSGWYEDDIEVGHWKSWYPNGQIREESYMKRVGEESFGHGEYKEWYRNGQIKKEVDDGDYRLWYEDGQKMLQGQFGRNESDSIGEWTVWYENGRKQMIVNYDKKGVKKGDYKYWNEYGKLIQEARYAFYNTKFFDTNYHYRGTTYKGKTTRTYDVINQHPYEYRVWYYDRKDKLTERLSYAEGELNGFQTKWWWSEDDGKKGQKHYEFYAKSNQLDSICQEWTESGDLVFDQFYKSGKNVSLPGLYLNESGQVSLLIKEDQSITIVGLEINPQDFKRHGNKSRFEYSSPTGYDPPSGLEVFLTDSVNDTWTLFPKLQTTYSYATGQPKLSYSLDNALRMKNLGTLHFDKLTLDTLIISNFSMGEWDRFSGFNGLDSALISQLTGSFYRQQRSVEE